MNAPQSHRLPIIGIALEPAGWHPAAWRLQGHTPTELFTAPYWLALLRDIDASVVDFVTFEESIGLQSSDFRAMDGKEDQVRGRLSPVALTALAVFGTQQLGVIAARNLTHSEPYSIATEIASLNVLSGGRVGLRAQITSRSIDTHHFVRPQPVPELKESDIYFPEKIGTRLAPVFSKATESIEILRALWSTWTEDALLDGTDGRFVDVNKISAQPITTATYDIAGPLGVPVTTAMQPVVLALAHHANVPYKLATAAADVILVTQTPSANGVSIGDVLNAVETECTAVQRDLIARPLTILVDLVVFLGATRHEAVTMKRALDELSGAPYSSDTEIFVGSVGELVRRIEELVAAGADGVRLRPAVNGSDIPLVLQQLGLVFGSNRLTGTLRERLHLGSLETSSTT
ncbi:UNVERIFIED_ORG: alkanesulfonate monooxygenase SsuD/methylene tetrahydromethanopterin reductase-like flavin-dependent oxidoreductase (luciferase family) [Nocardia globerula]|uniref:Alkanesulfonate monooxygenase SsuD/methylene tetrahydromethanopterin reductase-like flavin-dependent oxidoreductase (Luciferase family) n=1 Tax=Nocardia globerula TaxID=1818 RepID=A0A652YJR4_NOCGL|nr:LLM class flavin-dependent oxidoreductase [Rhodococcus globerulus]NMD62011.1 LLM class flavin-dependent oxidoreductase [Nocardia globerula]PVX65903.1 alkanesulfonate monooxygenase SsuD/methylene tetrahydromethanopterin reductase-like flavin-dependent oxidoreductase (luciferase family) [Rhodococcus globerulus]